ncbi:hypothetical protein Tco_0990820 [Tanacetum coccineum]|uniref:Reverse transcriptase domain-containing protein n=1 Tax=Tanacetum coccineum TaxID=301880 RepID=A0ABQ5EXK2_9ASTR
MTGHEILEFLEVLSVLTWGLLKPKPTDANLDTSLSPIPHTVTKNRLDCPHRPNLSTQSSHECIIPNKLHQLDTFYNALTPTDQDSLNVTAGGNLLTITPRDALTIIENKSKLRNSRNKPIVSKVSTNGPSSSTPYFPEIATLADVVKAMLAQKSSSPTSVKAVEEICVTCGGPHPYHQCLATDGNIFPEYRDNIQGYVLAAAVNYNQGNTGYRP